MSDTTIAILIVPLLLGLTIVLECTRIGCTWLHRRAKQITPRSGVEPAQGVRRPSLE